MTRMRIICVFGILTLLLAACGKDKYTTDPQISYKSVNPNFVDNNTSSATPVLTFSITDAEGDLGITSTDTAFIHVKNLRTGDSALFTFPDIKDATKKDFKADVAV